MFFFFCFNKSHVTHTLTPRPVGVVHLTMYYSLHAEARLSGWLLSTAAVATVACVCVSHTLENERCAYENSFFKSLIILF